MRRTLFVAGFVPPLVHFQQLEADRFDAVRMCGSVPPVTPPVAGICVLKRVCEAQDVERKDFGDEYDEHDLVFCLIDGKPVRPPTVTKAFKARVTACGLPLIRLHDMRHGACSLLLAGGVPIEVVQMILGHATPEVTRRVYAHVMKKATRLWSRRRRSCPPGTGASNWGAARLE